MRRSWKFQLCWNRLGRRQCKGADSSADAAADGWQSTVEAQLGRLLDLSNTVHDGRSILPARPLIPGHLNSLRINHE